MDESCSSLCSGIKVYDLLETAQAKGKKVYVLASHSHYFQENIYDTPEHKGHVVPGWIIGTAGAEQYQDKISYGYLQVEVTPKGTIKPTFIEVKRDTSSITPAESSELLDYCFNKNKEDSAVTAKKKADPNNKKTRAFCGC